MTTGEPSGFLIGGASSGLSPSCGRLCESRLVVHNSVTLVLDKEFVKRSVRSSGILQSLMGLAICLAAGGLAAEDWPHWRGPNRDGTTGEDSGWQSGAWPPAKKLWQVNVGQGSTSPIVVGERLYTAGWQDDRDIVQCRDVRTGKVVWQQAYPCPLYGRKSEGDKGIYAGMCSTPEFDPQTGFLYTLSIDGDLHCWDTNKQGRRVWGLNLYDQFDPPKRARVNRSGRRDYGYTSAPLIYEDSLIVEVGAAAGTLMAFDRRKGKPLWGSKSNVSAGHTGGPVRIDVEGVPCVAAHTFAGLLVVRLDKRRAGETVATYPWKTDFANNIATPAVHENNIVLTSAYNHYKIARLRITLDGCEKVWEQDFASKVCSPVIVDGRVYWAFQKLYCLDFETGELQWQGGPFGAPGSCIATADDRLIVWANRGDLFLTETARRSPKAYKELAAQRNLLRRDAWPHVVLAGGRLFCKDRDGNLVCLSLFATSP